jgi:hypothetical protein
MATLDFLYQTLEALDKDLSKGHSLKGKSYDLTHNAQLGFQRHKEDSADFHVGLPYHDRTREKGQSGFKNHLTTAFEDTLSVGIDRLFRTNSYSVGKPVFNG